MSLMLSILWKNGTPLKILSMNPLNPVTTLPILSEVNITLLYWKREIKQIIYS